MKWGHACLNPRNVTMKSLRERTSLWPHQYRPLVGRGEYNSRGCSRARNVPNIAEDGWGAWQACSSQAGLALEILQLSQAEGRKMLYGWWLWQREKEIKGRWDGQSCQTNLTKTSNLHLPCCHIEIASRRCRLISCLSSLPRWLAGLFSLHEYNLGKRSFFYNNLKIDHYIQLVWPTVILFFTFSGVSTSTLFSYKIQHRKLRKMTF